MSKKGCKKKKKKKKKKRGGGGEKKGQPKDASFSEPSFKSLVVVCGTLERRHGRRL